MVDSTQGHRYAVGEAEECSIDLLWAAIAGLRADVERLIGRLERIASAAEPKGTAEEVAEAWRAERQKEIDRLLEQRAAQGKGEELDSEDIEEIGNAWLCS